MRVRSAVGSFALAVVLAGLLGFAGKAADGLSCASFVTQEDAQAVLDAGPDDRFALDTDRNGVACDDMPLRDDAAADVPSPKPTATPSRFADATATDVDRFWRRAFKKAKHSYAPPAALVALGPLDATPCGPGGFASPAFYCPLDRTVYYDDAFFAERDDGGYGRAAWVLMLAHEWGHHAQGTLGLLDGYEGTADATGYSMAL